jgi:beta-phosphoglucomutase
MSERIAVIFDMDGVLIDSYWAHFRSWQILASDYQRDYTEAEFAAGFGRTSREVIAQQWTDEARTPAEAEELAERKESIFRELISHHLPAMDGARDLVESLHTAGFHLAVGSSGPPDNVALVLEKMGIERWIEARVTGADVTRGKPHPQVFQLAAQRLEVPPAQCVVIEDAAAGIAAAHAAGMKCIALASTGHTLEELKEADLLVQTLRTLAAERIRELLSGLRT